MRSLLLGHGGREAIIAEKMASKFSLFSIMPYKNPTICKYVKESGGKYFIGSPFDKTLIKKILKEENIQLCIVNNDDLLEAGIIDLAREMNINTFGPTREGAKIEWSKDYGLNLINEIVPEIANKTYIAFTKNELNNIIKEFQGCDFVVKPNGLTAGKGVKVGGEHFKIREDGINYAKSCLEKDGMVILQEKIEGYEFTIMGFTDGNNIITAPATYDYPYRFNDDLGPGTGGMGCFSCKDGLLPFLTESDYLVCKLAMEKVLHRINKKEVIFNGVLNGGFFKTKNGIRFMEFNARLGDPEALNILSIMDTNFADVVYDIAVNKYIDDTRCKFKDINSYVLYIVTQNYALDNDNQEKYFNFDERSLSNKIHVYYSSCEKVGDCKYRIQGNSRLFALVQIGDNMKEIKSNIDSWAKENILDRVLDYRTDIGVLAIDN